MSHVNRAARRCPSLMEQLSCRRNYQTIRALTEFNRKERKRGAKNDNSGDRDKKKVPCGAPKCARQSPHFVIKSVFKHLNYNEYFIGKITIFLTSFFFVIGNIGNIGHNKLHNSKQAAKMASICP